MDRNMVFLLKCIFRFSENAGSVRSARMLLYAKATGDEKPLVDAAAGVYGGFMQAVCSGDVIEACLRGDDKNRAAIKEGMLNLFHDKAQICEGLDPEEFAPENTHTERLEESSAIQYIEDLGYKK